MSNTGKDREGSGCSTVWADEKGRQPQQTSPKSGSPTPDMDTKKPQALDRYARLARTWNAFRSTHIYRVYPKGRDRQISEASNPHQNKKKKVLSINVCKQFSRCIPKTRWTSILNISVCGNIKSPTIPAPIENEETFHQRISDACQTINRPGAFLGCDSSWAEVPTRALNQVEGISTF